MSERANRRSLWIGLAAVLAVALVGRLLLLASGAVSFHSDEAVVALMARHILQGARPIFFYGQAYMGSLDPWLVAAGFALLGQSVQTIRIVQSALYLGVVAASFGAAYVLSGRASVAAVAGLMLAVPNVLVALYTTATLGGYNETLLLGALIVLVGFPIARGSAGPWRWALVGLLAGLGWWINALIVVYALPLGLLLFVRLWRARGDGPRLLIGPALALAGFALGSAPWWLFAFEHDLAPLRFLIGDRGGPFASAEGTQPFGVRLIGLAAFGLPAVLGLRFPWSPDYTLPIIGVPVAAVYLTAFVWLVGHARNELQPDGRGFVLTMILGFLVIFFVSRFSGDPTGRYLLPLVLPAVVMLGAFVTSLGHFWLQAFLVGMVVVFHGLGQVVAVRGPVGMTTQFALNTHIESSSDQTLIDFLGNHELKSGYTTHWVAFRLAFLSDEELQFSSSLPYKADLSYARHDERYPPYRAAADAAPPVFLTANTPALDVALERLFADAGVTYSVERIGPYRVYYAFEPADAVPRPPFAFE